MAAEKISKELEDIQEEKEKTNVLDAIIKKCGYNPLEISGAKACFQDCVHHIELITNLYNISGYRLISFSHRIEKRSCSFSVYECLFIVQKSIKYEKGFKQDSSLFTPFPTTEWALWNALKEHYVFLLFKSRIDIESERIIREQKYP